ncbi:MAG TPA: A/G-specific adenine glycosylase [Chiayiivirga sp.]|nr:A/G-specific adenine glycosylase [Chiayiivirga sp.]
MPRPRDAKLKHVRPVTPFAERLLAWFDHHGRHDLPWQHPREPYRVWLAEVMLQQTQVQTVIPYFTRFISALPDLAALANASEEQVLALWSGLGYYSRARNLHETARICLQRHAGALPKNFDELMALPGIGRSTAGAVLAQAHDLPLPILDGNVKRVLTRWAGIEGWPGDTEIQKQLWALSEQLLPEQRLADYTQALMDLGATACTRSKPDCTRCPVRADCIALRDGRVACVPTPRPRKVVPQRHCLMLLARDVEGRVLLQRRQGSGVWQGLWSLPEAMDETSLRHLVSAQISAPFHCRALAAIEHAFSHYRLLITPMLADPVTQRVGIADTDEDWRWVAADAWPSLGLPAPVRRLLLAQASL